MLTMTDLVADGLKLPQLPIEPIEAEGFCAINGCKITRGYRVMDMVTDATGEFLDTFRGNPHGLMSVSAARCYRATNPKGINLCSRAMFIFEGGSAYLPLISRESAVEQERPCWSDLVRDVWPEKKGKRCVIILTTDNKKRLWPRARLSVLGSGTQVFVYDNARNANRIIRIDWEVMLADLDLFEEVYSAGWTKAAIATSLYRQQGLCLQAGMSQVRQWEDGLRAIRSHDWFDFVYLVAQKKGKE